MERIARRGFEIARERGGRLTSVDKVNVLHTSRLWRDVVTELGAADYPDVALDHALVDSFAMTIVHGAETIDVVLTENTFGDILSDVAAAVTGGLGLAASASLGDGRPGLFEPVHGSAPQIAGHGIANPAAMLRSTALLLRHGLGLAAEADALERRSTMRSSRRRPRTSAAARARGMSATPCCARSTPDLPCHLDGERRRHLLHLCVLLRLRLSALAGAPTPPPRAG